MNNFVKQNQDMSLGKLEKSCPSLSEDAQKFLGDIENEEGTGKTIFRGKKVTYEILSSKDIIAFDKSILSVPEKREKYESLRSLRIAGSHVLPGARYLVALADTLKSLVIYNREGVEYIIDYANNLIMKKDDYKEIFPYEVIEEINQCDLCYLAQLIKNADGEIPLPLILTCFREIKEDLRCHIPDYIPKYYSNGINSANDFILDIDNETLFWLNADYYSEYNYDANVINEFTLNPLVTRLPIERVDNKKYCYKDYEFSLFSDFVISEEQKRELLSDARVGKCFLASVETLFGMTNVAEDRKKVALGNVKIRDKENFLHAVAMFKSVKTDEWKTVDYTANLVMNSGDYNVLKNYTIINEISYEVMNYLYDYLEQWGPFLDKFLILYFGNEMLRDLEKNKSLFKGMQ